MTVAGITPRRDQHVPLDWLRLDGQTQPRVSIDEATVAEYAEAMKADAAFPPAIVYFDGTDHWLADGFHRYHAARKIGFTNLLAEVRTGTRRDAVLFSVGANDQHGMRRTNADKRKAVQTLLADAEWSQWTDEVIASRCAVSREFVNRLRPKPAPCDPVTSTDVRRFIRKGKETTMDVTNLRKSPADVEARREAALKALKEDPAASNVILAKRAGVGDHLIGRVRKEEGIGPRVALVQSRGLEERRKKFAVAMTGLDGYVLGLEGLRLEDFADDARAEYWAGQLTKMITSLRALRSLLQDSRKETA